MYPHNGIYICHQLQQLYLLKTSHYLFCPKSYTASSMCAALLSSSAQNLSSGFLLSGRFSLNYVLQKERTLPTCEHIYLPPVVMYSHQNLLSSVVSKSYTGGGMSVAVLPFSAKHIVYLQALVTHLPRKALYILFKDTQTWMMSAVLLFSLILNARTRPPLKTTKIWHHGRWVSLCLSEQSKKVKKNTHVLPALVLDNLFLVTVRRHVYLKIYTFTAGVYTSSNQHL
jgi:hypothetical protein